MGRKYNGLPNTQEIDELIDYGDTERDIDI